MMILSFFFSFMSMVLAKISGKKDLKYEQSISRRIFLVPHYQVMILDVVSHRFFHVNENFLCVPNTNRC